MSTKGELERHYRDLLLSCDRRLDRIERELPPGRMALGKELQRRGISRRQFLQWSSALTASLLLPPVFSSRVALAAESFSRLPVIWLHFAECTGCSESVLRTDSPGIDQILLDAISLEYHETLMAAAGSQAEEALQDALETFRGRFVCVVEGALPTGLSGGYLTMGPRGVTGLERAREVTRQAAAVICVGSCACFGNVPAARPNPTDARGAGEALDMPVMNIPGCPVNAVSFIGTVTYFILFGRLPPADDLSRPLWAYGKSNHEFCERRTHFEAGEFVDAWDSEGARKGWCLFKMGCRGPFAHNNCARVRWNHNESWPVKAGHGCVACSEPGFWDADGPLYYLQSPYPAGEQQKRYRSQLQKLGISLDSATARGLGVGNT